jgi:hypothetical protein
LSDNGDNLLLIVFLAWLQQTERANKVGGTAVMIAKAPRFTHVFSIFNIFNRRRRLPDPPVSSLSLHDTDHALATTALFYNREPPATR